MKYYKLRSRITALIVAAAFAWTSVPVYAKDLEPAPEVEDVNSIEATEPEIISLTISVEEITEPAEEAESEAETETEVEVEAEAETETEVEVEAKAEAETEEAEAETETKELSEASIDDQDISSGGIYTPEIKDKITGDSTTYTKTVESFSTSQSSTGRYNASFVLTETNEMTGESKRYNYTVSGFTNEESARNYVDAMCSLTGTSGDMLYVIQDNNLVDAEKLPYAYEPGGQDPETTPYDSNLCWAGSVCDMLELSGWNKLGDHNYKSQDVSNEDKIFDLYANSFFDDASNQYYGLSWFFNGFYEAQYFNGWAHLKDDYHQQGMLNEYRFDDIVKFVNIDKKDSLTDVLKALDKDSDGDRCSLGLVFGYYSMTDGEVGNRDGGHCVTIVGYSTDDNGIPNTITIADSDSYNSEGFPGYSKDNNRTSYKNAYTTYPVKYYDGNWHLMNFVDDSCDTILDNIFTLKYYSDNTKNMVDIGGTHNVANDIDLVIFNQILFQDDEYTSCESVFQGESLKAAMRIYNKAWSTDDTARDIPFRFVISKDGELVRTHDYIFNSTGLDKAESSDILSGLIMDENSPLEPGEYTVSFIVNYDNSVREAYYYNNEAQTKLTFVVLKREDSNGDTDYIVIPDINISEELSDEEYAEVVEQFIQNISDYTAVTEQTSFLLDRNKVLEMRFTNGNVENLAVSEEDIQSAEIIFDYSVDANMQSQGSRLGGNITSKIVITKNDYRIERNADGSIKLVFGNEFMRKLPKGTHYFKLKIAGKQHIFKIEVR